MPKIQIQYYPSRGTLSSEAYHNPLETSLPTLLLSLNSRAQLGDPPSSKFQIRSPRRTPVKLKAIAEPPRLLLNKRARAHDARATRLAGSVVYYCKNSLRTRTHAAFLAAFLAHSIRFGPRSNGPDTPVLSCDPATELPPLPLAPTVHPRTRLQTTPTPTAAAGCVAEMVPPKGGTSTSATQQTARPTATPPLVVRGCYKSNTGMGWASVLKTTLSSGISPWSSNSRKRYLSVSPKKKLSILSRLRGLELRTSSRLA